MTAMTWNTAIDLTAFRILKDDLLTPDTPVRLSVEFKTYCLRKERIDI